MFRNQNFEQCTDLADRGTFWVSRLWMLSPVYEIFQNLGSKTTTNPQTTRSETLLVPSILGKECLAYLAISVGSFLVININYGPRVKSLNNSTITQLSNNLINIKQMLYSSLF